MAKIKFTLDTRKKSKSSTTGLYPIVLRVFHKKPRFIYLNYQTSPEGWDSSKMKLKKSILANKDLDIDTINNDIYDKIHLAQMVIRDIGDAIDQTNVDNLVQLIKVSWESKNSSSLKQRIVNGITLAEWGGELIRRKEMFNKPSSARWYKDSINAFLKFNNGDDLLLDDIDVTFLKNFQAYRESIGNSKNSISAYMRAVRAIYNGAIA
ncbi:phage integrase SAM-like domain-containing protein, partial [Flavobacteriaceae bacterium F89]